MPLRYGSALCLIALSFLRYCHLRYASLRHAFCVMPTCVMPVCVYGYLRDTYLRYAFLRYASFRDGHLQNRLVAIQPWIDAFMIWTMLFQILIIEFCHRYTFRPRASSVAQPPIMAISAQSSLVYPAQPCPFDRYNLRLV